MLVKRHSLRNRRILRPNRLIAILCEVDNYLLVEVNLHKLVALGCELSGFLALLFNEVLRPCAGASKSSFLKHKIIISNRKFIKLNTKSYILQAPPGWTMTGHRLYLK